MKPIELSKKIGGKIEVNSKLKLTKENFYHIKINLKKH